MHVWEDEFLLLAGWEDLVEVDGHAEGDEEEASDAGFGPVWGLEWGWGDELVPEGAGALGWEDGGFGGNGIGFWEGEELLFGGVGEEGVEVGLGGGEDVGKGGEGGEV